jgi:hypothetical protein
MKAVLLVIDTVVENVINVMTYDETVKNRLQIFVPYNILNNTDTISELDYALKAAGAIPGFEPVPLFLSLLVITLVIIRKRK